MAQKMTSPFTLQSVFFAMSASRYPPYTKIIHYQGIHPLTFARNRWIIDAFFSKPLGNLRRMEEGISSHHQVIAVDACSEDDLLAQELSCLLVDFHHNPQSVVVVSAIFIRSPVETTRELGKSQTTFGVPLDGVKPCFFSPHPCLNVLVDDLLDLILCQFLHRLSYIFLRDPGMSEKKMTKKREHVKFIDHLS